MKRLTTRNETSMAFWVDPRCVGGGYRMTEDKKDQERLDRLAAYEDTGLTPEEVEALKADNDRLHRLIDESENELRKESDNA